MNGLLDVHLEIFEGPLDLLLYLVKKNNIDIHDIPISRITEEYLEYLQVMKELDLEIAGEFLVMAATLMDMKIKALLPKPQSSNEQEANPEQELSKMLEEYQKYKNIANMLSERYNRFKDIFFRGSPVFSPEERIINVDLPGILDAVKKALERVGSYNEIEPEDVPIESRIEKILNILKEKKYTTLDDIFLTEKTRKGIITCFLALLELIRTNKVGAIQEEIFGEIKIYLKDDVDEKKVEVAYGTGQS